MWGVPSLVVGPVAQFDRRAGFPASAIFARSSMASTFTSLGLRGAAGFSTIWSQTSRKAGAQGWQGDGPWCQAPGGGGQGHRMGQNMGG